MTDQVSNRNFVIGIGLAVALLVINAGLAYRNISQLKDAAGWLAHTYEVLDRLEEVASTVKDAETGQRGFIITNEQRYLRPYQAAVAELPPRIDRLESLTADNSAQQREIPELRRRIAAKMTELSQVIDLRRQSSEAARQEVLSDRGLLAMTAVRDQVDTMKTEELRLLVIRQQDTAQSYRVALATVTVTTAVGLSLVAGCIWLLWRNLQVRAEAAARVRQEREWLRTTLASIGDAVIATDGQGQVAFLNGVAQALTGCSETDALGRPLDEVFVIHNEQTRARIEHPVARVLREGCVVGLANHTVLISKQGAEYPIEDSAAPIKDLQGSIIGVVLVFKDASERRRAEDAMHFTSAASAALSTLFDTSSTFQRVAGLAVPFLADWCAVDLADDKGVLHREAIAHGNSREIDRLADLLAPDSASSNGPCDTAAVWRSGRSQWVCDTDANLAPQAAHDDASRRALREAGLKACLAVPLRASGKVLGVLTLASTHAGRPCSPADLTVAEDFADRAAIAIENARLYARGARETGAKTNFWRCWPTMRNPLAPIRNALSILRLRHGDAATLERCKEMMERQLEHLVRLVDDLLDVSRILRGQIDLQRQPIELQEVAQRAVEASEPFLKSRGHVLNVSLPKEPVWVDGDTVRLTQVVGNLLNNAAKFTSHPDRISLMLQRDDGQAVVRVRDRGIGISTELLPRIFDVFVQADSSLARSQGGLGIGLTLVRRIVAMHGGTVEAISAGRDQGSEFVVRLPVAVAPIDRPQAAKGPCTPLPSARRVLVVDDNVDAANTLAMLLRLLHQDVVQVVFDGPAAMKAIEQLKPDVVFLDIGLPGMSGYDVAKKLRARPEFRDLLLVAVTGYGQEDDRRRSREAGFDHHLVKPIPPQAIEQVLAG